MERAKQLQRSDGEEGSYWGEEGDEVGIHECLDEGRLDNSELLTLLSIE